MKKFLIVFIISIISQITAINVFAGSDGKLEINKINIMKIVMKLKIVLKL